MFPIVSGASFVKTYFTEEGFETVVAQCPVPIVIAAEPGGGGYIAQRLLSAKDERNAVGATLLFNFLHYALRSWPWLIVALASIVVIPNMEVLQASLPADCARFVKEDMAYPAMIAKLPPGWLGLVVASLVAAYMSTIATQINWG